MQRRQLVGVFKLLSLIGAVLLALPMLMSTGIFKSSAPAARGILVDTRHIQPGHYQSIEYAGREFWVYHWSAQDRQRDNVPDDRQAWSVLVPYEPYRGCRVHLQDYKADAGRFVEPCFNAGFDAKGRRWPGTGVAAQRDLPAIAYQWQNDHDILIQPGKTATQE